MSLEERIPVVIAGSYDRKRDFTRRVVAIHDERKARGAKFPGKMLWRGDGEFSEFLKGNYLLGGVPALLYPIVADIFAKHTGNIYVMGNDATEKLVSRAQSYFASTLNDRGKKLSFVHEGSGKNGFPLPNSLRKFGAALRSDDANSPVFFQTGDTPLADPDAVLSTYPHDDGLDVYMSVNAFSRVNGRFSEKYPKHGVFPKSYHLSMEVDGSADRCKEGNGAVIRLSDDLIAFAEKFYKMRKGSGLRIAKYILTNLTGILSETYPSESACWKELGSQVMKKLYRKSRMDWTRMPIKSSTLTRTIERIENQYVVPRPDHCDPGQVADFDEDHEYVFLALAMEQDPTIFPYHDAISSFARDEMGQLAKEAPVFAKNSFGQYMNKFFDLFDDTFSPIHQDGSLRTDACYEHYAFDEERVNDFITLKREYNDQNIANVSERANLSDAYL